MHLTSSKLGCSWSNENSDFEVKKDCQKSDGLFAGNVLDYQLTGIKITEKPDSCIMQGCFRF